MKATVEQLADLKRRIARAIAKNNLTYTEIAEIAQVHPSQVSRICRGDFKTISHNVVQICIALGLELRAIEMAATKEDASWLKIKARVRSICNETPEGAEKIARLLEIVGQFRSG